MSSHISQQNFKLNSNDYVKLLVTLVKSWPDRVATKKAMWVVATFGPLPYFRKEAEVVVEEIFYDFINSDFWFPKSLGCNLTDYCVCGGMQLRKALTDLAATSRPI